MADDSPFIWHELVTADQGASGAFFCGPLGWMQRRVDVLVPPHDVPDVGRICAVADPTGAVAHLMQPTGR